MENEMNLTPSRYDLKKFHASLLTWFATAQRDHLPWRNTSDPYAVLVAEKLLQQTSARQLVVDIYREFIIRYPTPRALSEANLLDLRRLLHSLGFSYRADELIQMGKELEERHLGQIPSDLGELLALKGIGQYCARAVLAFAFGRRIAIVDTNVARFIYRFMGLNGKPPPSPATNKQLLKIADELLFKKSPREYNLAILDLCDAVCKKKTPQCGICPVKRYCEYGSQQDYSVSLL
jgi:A/G-specific adenine glycosylase